MRTVFLAIALLQIVALPCACQRYEQVENVNRETPKPRTHPYFRMSDENVKMLWSGLRQLRTGDHYDRIVALLGKPDGDDDLYTKGIGARFVARRLLYKVVIYEEGLVNEIHDCRVDILLNAKGELKEIRVMNPELVGERPIE